MRVDDLWLQRQHAGKMNDGLREKGEPFRNIRIVAAFLTIEPGPLVKVRLVDKIDCHPLGDLKVGYGSRNLLNPQWHRKGEFIRANLPEFFANPRVQGR